MAWRAARSIIKLQQQLRPLAPGAPAESFGTIGDTSHNSKSDHAPKDFPGWGNDIVTAGDFPNGWGLDSHRVLEAIRASRDPRVKYGISRGRMFSSYPTSSHPAWSWRSYSGSDGHFTHGHLSVVGDARADGQQAWSIGYAATTTGGTAVDTATVLRVKMMYENWAPNKAGWVAAGGNPADYDALVAAGSGLNNLCLALAAMQADLNSIKAIQALHGQALGVAQEDLDDIQSRIGSTVSLSPEQLEGLKMGLASALAGAMEGAATEEDVRRIVDTQLDQAFTGADPRGVDSEE